MRKNRPITGPAVILTGIIGLLAAASCKHRPDDTMYEYRIRGETLALADTEPDSLLFDRVDQVQLYGLTETGEVVSYHQGTDYTLEGNRVRRTADSPIPNLADHRVRVLDNGKFRWNSEPDRNPELTLPYQIYADYTVLEASPDRVTPPLFSEGVFQKIAAKGYLRLACIGTSISFGVHTYARHYHNSDFQTYPQIIARALNRHYGITCQVINRSTDGGTVDQIRDLSAVIAEQPDVVLLEMGMNDHTGTSPNAAAFRDVIDNAVSVLQAEGIEVILVGFFQQNCGWELEYEENTLNFNTILKEVASECRVGFADIYSAFERLDKTKLYTDYMGDYMHHPTSFGHQLYYLEIMPFFLDRPIERSVLWSYVN